MMQCNCLSDKKNNWKLNEKGERTCLVCGGTQDVAPITFHPSRVQNQTSNSNNFCSCGDKVREQYGESFQDPEYRCGFCSKVRSRTGSKRSNTNTKRSSIDSQIVDFNFSNDSWQLIAAVNRTTHAVRAFVLFLFYQLTALTLALFTYWLAQFVGNYNSECSDQLRAFGACSPNSFLLVIAFLIWIIGVIYSSNVGWREIKKSEVANG